MRTAEPGMQGSRKIGAIGASTRLRWEKEVTVRANGAML